MGTRDPGKRRPKGLAFVASLLALGGLAAIWFGAPGAPAWAVTGIGMAGVIAFGVPGSGDGGDGSDDGGEGGGDGGGE